MSQTPQERDAAIIASAAEFTATLSLGSGARETKRFPTLAEARNAAILMYVPKGKPVGIYAVTVDGTPAFVENYPPTTPWMSAKDRAKADRLKKIERGE